MLQYEQRADRKSSHEWLYSGAGRRFLQLCVQELRSLVIGNIPFNAGFIKMFRKQGVLSWGAMALM